MSTFERYRVPGNGRRNAESIAANSVTDDYGATQWHIVEVFGGEYQHTIPDPNDSSKTWETWGTLFVVPVGELDAFKEEHPDSTDLDSYGYIPICEWFALCENESTGTQPHPILGDVPICGRCKEKVEALT